MLGEFIQHALMAQPKWVRRMGYGREMVALEARHGRCREAWRPHLDASRRLIGRAAASAPRTGRAVVLGSGPLLDIPLEDLAARFDRVELVDIVHPRSTRRRVRKLANVDLVEADVSGAAFDIYGLAITAEPAEKRPPPPIGLRGQSCAVIHKTITETAALGAALTTLPEPKPDDGLVAGADFVVSANLMSQLALLPLDWVASECPWADETAQLGFARQVVDHHLALLRRAAEAGARVTLITEVLRLVSDANDRPLEKIDPLFGAQIFSVGEEWWWEVAPMGERWPDAAAKLRVLGIADLAAAPQSRVCRNTTLAAP